MRYASGLGAKHWRKPGEGKPHCGWEDAYDAGALFLCWLTGETPEVDARPGEPTQPIQQQQQQPTGTYSAQQPFATQYPQNPGTGAGPPAVPAGRPNPNARARRGPFPDIVRTLDTRLRTQRFSEQWWVELTGASLEQLWREYQDYYRK